MWYVLILCFNVSHNSFKSGQYIERACFYLSVICLSILSETFDKDFIIIIIIIIIIYHYLVQELMSAQYFCLLP